MTTSTRPKDTLAAALFCVALVHDHHARRRTAADNRRRRRWLGARPAIIRTMAVAAGTTTLIMVAAAPSPQPADRADRVQLAGYPDCGSGTDRDPDCETAALMQKLQDEIQRRRAKSEDMHQQAGDAGSQPMKSDPNAPKPITRMRRVKVDPAPAPVPIKKMHRVPMDAAPTATAPTQRDQ